MYELVRQTNGALISNRMWLEERQARIGPQPTFAYDDDDGDTPAQTVQKQLGSLSRRLNVVEAFQRMKQDVAAGRIPAPRTAPPAVPQQAAKPQFVPLSVEVERV